jgi:hypothetical protein
MIGPFDYQTPSRLSRYVPRWFGQVAFEGLNRLPTCNLTSGLAPGRRAMISLASYPITPL